MTKTGDKPRLEKGPKNTAIVRAYTDLKRHNLCDDANSANPIRWFCNEQLAQGRPDQNGKPGSEFFLTRKLWDVGNTAPYGHRGDISTITEAILYHGGEARASRDAFAAKPVEDQKALVAFLKTLQVVPQKK
nr:di-heme oxidoredictase family protein [Methylobacter sp. BlB1]